MSDKRPSVTRVVKYIRKGVGISYTNVEYADSTSNSVAPTSGWKTTAPAWQNGHYIWQRVHIVYTDGTDGYSNPVCLSGGKGISKIEEYYLATSSASGVTTSTSGWTKAIQSVTAEKKYLWNYEVVTYTDGTNTVTTPVIIGTYGDKGVGISSITEHYLATSAASGVTRSTTGWTTSIQTVTNTKKYLWNYETVTYTDGSTADTDPVIIGAYGDEGPRGYRGPGLRGPQDWALMDIDYQFYKGDESTQEPYEDFVVYNGNYYKCVKSHTKTSYNYPGSTADTSNGYWQLSDKLAMVAANVLFAKHGYFGSAIISGDWMISTNGMIDNTFCENGATYQGIIAYSLFNENNPSGDDVLIYGSSTTWTKTASETTKTIATVSLEAGKLYYLKATGKAGSASGQYFFIRIRNISTGITNTPVMIYGTSNVTRSGYFSPGTTGSYYLEFYDTSGISAEVSAIELTRKDFAPTFALDLLTGATYQHDGLFTGFVRKRKTKITSSNISRYKRDDITTATVLDFNKCGSFVELSTGVTDTYLAFPLLNSYLAGEYTEAQKDYIRGFIGTTLLIYNKSGNTLNFTYKMLSAQTFTDTLANNSFVELLCELDSENGNEVVYWKEIKKGSIV